MKNKFLLTALVATMILSYMSILAAGGFLHRCGHCGCDCECQKVCRLVCEEKKVPVVCWGCKCEDFCLPGPSQPCCKNCDEVCASCADEKAGVCVEPKKFVWYNWCPSECGSVHTKTKLMKKVVIKTIPSYKWVVEDVCASCGPKCQSVEIPKGTVIPPPPAVAARVLAPKELQELTAKK